MEAPSAAKAPPQVQDPLMNKTATRPDSTLENLIVGANVVHLNAPTANKKPTTKVSSGSVSSAGNREREGALQSAALAKAFGVKNIETDENKEASAGEEEFKFACGDETHPCKDKECEEHNKHED